MLPQWWLAAQVRTLQISGHCTHSCTVSNIPKEMRLYQHTCFKKAYHTCPRNTNLPSFFQSQGTNESRHITSSLQLLALILEWNFY